MLTLKYGSLAVKVKNVSESYDYSKQAHVVNIIPEDFPIKDAKLLGEGEYILENEDGIEITRYQAAPERYTRNVQENIYTLTLTIK